MNFLLALLMVTGLAIAGSDGPLFPWLNFAGLGPWIVMIRIYRRMEEKKWKRRI